MNPVKVLGLDPGIASLGYGLLVAGGTLSALDCGVVVTSVRRGGRRLSDGERLAAIEAVLEGLVAGYMPDAICYEAVYQGMGRPGQTTQAVRIGKVLGIVERLAYRTGIEVASYAPPSVQAMVRALGEGMGMGPPPPGRRGRKAYTVKVLERMLGTRITSHHAADALAVAVYHARRHEAHQASHPQLHPQGR